ncbi:MAG: inositol monophosphatase family protein [Chloroflexota bacterium]|jgi:myo-inositol-1(or 4)-monophosphatase
MNNRTDELHLATLAEVAASAAKAAGTVLLDHWKNGYAIHFKGDIDLVTDADRQAEATIVSLIRSRFPDHEILAEEGSGSGGTASSSYRWIIDPLDGTTNYAHRYPHFAVSIAVEQAGAIIVGTVYDPVLGELFEARVGEGAYLNGRPLQVSSVDRLLRALLCTGFPYDRKLFKPCLNRWEYFIRRSQAVRRDGSAALDVCYVAAGRFDGYWEEHLAPWDVAAGVLIVREAGGMVTGLQGQEPDIYRGGIVASNGLIHAELLQGLSDADTSVHRNL